MKKFAYVYNHVDEGAEICFALAEDALALAKDLTALDVEDLERLELVTLDDFLGYAGDTDFMFDIKEVP